MADDPAHSSWFSRGLEILKVLTIVIAGVWVLYTFVLKEISKTHHIIPSIEVRAYAPADRGTDAGRFRAFELDLTAHNASERDVYIIAGIARANVYQSKPEPDAQFDQYKFDTHDTGPQLMMKPLRWRAKQDVLAVLATFLSFDLARGGKANQQYILLVPSAEFDILEIWTDFHVVDACPGIFGWESCFDFAVIYGNESSKNCKERSNISFKYSTRGRDDWKSICKEELRARFRYEDFQTTRMVILPDAPILKSK